MTKSMKKIGGLGSALSGLSGLSAIAGAAAWTPASPTSDGGYVPHSWERPGIENYQDAGKTTPATADTDPVRVSVNQGSDSHELTAPADANRFTLRTGGNGLNGQPIWQLPDGTDLLRAAFNGGAISQPFTVVATVQLDSSAVLDGSQRYTIADGDDTTNRMWLRQNQLAPCAWGITAGTVLDTYSPADDDWNIISVTFNGASSIIRVNGITRATGNGGAQTPNGLTLGSTAASTNSWIGHLGEYLIYTANLSDNDEDQVCGYLANIYDLTYTNIGTAGGLSFTKAGGNPVFNTAPRPEIVELDANTWAMLYSPVGTADLRLATSPKIDPHNWTNYGSNPILTAGGTIRGAGVVKDGATFHVLYDTTGQLCYAYGNDLTALTKHSAGDVPVFSGQGSGWEEYVRLPGLIKVGSTYHMFYDGREGTATGETGAIGHATSTDMINWTRDPANPVISPDTNYGWQGSDVGAPYPVIINGTYYIFYQGYNGYGTPYPHWIGYVVTNSVFSSFTGFVGNPVLGLGASGAWDDQSVESPTFMQDGSNTYLYFHGSGGANVDVGYATLT